MVYVPTETLDFGKSPQISPTYTAYIISKSFEVSGMPNWRGFMEITSNNFSFSLSLICCLRFINQTPSDLTTIDTFLHLAPEECQKSNQRTFDRPLYSMYCTDPFRWFSCPELKHGQTKCSRVISISYAFCIYSHGVPGKLCLIMIILKRTTCRTIYFSATKR